MTEQDIYAALTDIFRDVFDNDALTPTPDLSAHDVPEWDSFNHVNLIVASEIRFGIKFKSAEIDGLQNVGDFVTLIRKKTEGGAAAMSA